jgi:uncharacterized protein YjbI with pentapeptide repeats
VGADLTGADLESADLDGSDLTNAQLEGALVSRCFVPPIPQCTPKDAGKTAAAH